MSDAAIRELLDRQAVADLMVRYADCVDARDFDGAAATFAEDGTADYLTGRLHRGRPEIARVLGGILRHFERTSHHLTNHRAWIDGDAARAVTYVYAFHRMADGDRPWHFWGRHDDRLRRVDGAWLIADRRLVGVDAWPDRPDVPRSLFAGHGALP